MPRPFKGKIDVDVRDSTPDWDVAVRRPDRDADAAETRRQRLIYSQWHTTALCSPTRSTFLTGRNHHQNGFAQIAEGAQGYPGYSSHIPPESGTMAHVLRDAGWSTFWIGKNHNVPIDEWEMGASKKNWPLGMGYDRFYGFLGGETNNWYPDLVYDNHYVDQPYEPEDGYYLSKDLADKALEFIRDTKQAAPDRPWYLWFCPGANHAPHHAPRSTSTSTRAGSTTATRRIASGCCRE